MIKIVIYRDSLTRGLLHLVTVLKILKFTKKKNHYVLGGGKKRKKKKMMLPNTLDFTMMARTIRW